MPTFSVHGDVEAGDIARNPLQPAPPVQNDESPQAHGLEAAAMHSLPSVGLATSTPIRGPHAGSAPLPQLKEQEMPPAQPQKEQETGVPRPAQASLFLPRHSQGIIRCDGNDTYTEIVSAPDVPYIKKTAKPKHADDGIGRTGTFCAAYSMMDRVKVEQVVDAFQTIKSMRIQRAGLLDSLAQYIFLHSALLEFLSTFDAYQNFK
eukprot:Em1033g2a